MKALILTLAATLMLTMTGCDSLTEMLTGVDNEELQPVRVEGDSNTINVQRGDGGNAVDSSTKPVVMPASGNLGVLGLLVIVAISMGGCINSSVSWSPTVSLYNSRGVVGNPTAIDEGTLDQSPEMLAEGGGSGSAEVGP